MKLSYESQINVAKALVSHKFNYFKIESGIPLLKCVIEDQSCDYCKVKRICNAVEFDFLDKEYYRIHYPELFI